MARRFGPVSPQAIASSCEIAPTPSHAVEKDRVFLHERTQLLVTLGEPLQPVAQHALKLRGQIRGEPSDPEVARIHASAGDLFEHVEDPFAQVKGVHDHALHAEVEARGAEPDEMARDAHQLGQKQPDRHRARRHL